VSERAAKENPETLALRAKPRAVTRLNRKSLVVIIGAAGLIALGACLWAFRARERVVAPVSGNDMRSMPPVTRAEGLERLPHDYDGWRPIPKLGPPAGELGRPVLHEEQLAGLDPNSNAFRPNPEEDAQRVARLRLQDEAAAAAKAQVFFQLSRTGSASTQFDAIHTSGTPLDVAALPAAAAAPNSTDENSDRDQQHKQGFIAQKLDPKIYATSLLQQPRSPYELLAGTVIAAALVTGINSDLPGQTVATVTQNVYDTVTGNFLLVPQGSKMLGQYDSQLAYGQRRVLLVWTRLIMPDGSSITLDRLQAVDPAGYAGLEDKVDSHWGRVFAGAALSTLLGVNSQLVAQDQSVNSGSVTVAIRQSSQDSVNQIGQQWTRKNLNVQPTLTVRPGFPLRIIIKKDVVLRPYGQTEVPEASS
jgi:type IV secretory pathway VirB10-like protein